jgi:hypothetical protein
MVPTAARFVGVVVLAGLLAGCYRPAAGTDVPTGEAPDLPAVPVDSTLAAVSRSNPGPDAKAALDLCGASDQLELVAGMALVPRARDVGKYMPTNGKEPELQSDTPVWLIQFKGELAHAHVGTVFNPVCMVMNGDYTPYGPYGDRSGTKAATLLPGFTAPILALPTLAP